MTKPVLEEVAELIALVRERRSSVPRNLVVFGMVHVNVVILVGVERKAEEGADDPGRVCGESRTGAVVSGVMEHQDEAAHEQEHLDRDVKPSGKVAGNHQATSNDDPQS